MLMPDDQGHHPSYDFIMNPGAKPKGGLFKGGDKKQRLLITVIAGGIGLVVVFIVLNLLFGGSGGSTDRLNGLVQQQTELIRVASLGEQDATDDTAKNLAITVELSLTSAKSQTTTTLSKVGGKLNTKLVGAKKDSATDEALAAAKKANRFDDVFVATMKEELTDYQAELKDFFNSTSSNTEKTLLQQLYKDAGVLIDSTE